MRNVVALGPSALLIDDLDQPSVLPRAAAKKPGANGHTKAPKRVMLVHDYLLVMRGAERAFCSLCEMWPHAPIASLFHDATVFRERLAGHEVKTSPLQVLGAGQSTFKALLPLLPWAVGRLDLSGYDLVISSSSAFAHGVKVDDDAVHVCYCYTPFRYAWYEHDAGVSQAPWVARPFTSAMLQRIRAWDLRAASGRTHYIAISRVSQERMARYWGVDAPIVYPPVELARFKPAEPEDYILVVGELVKHKRVEVALEAAKRAKVPVKVVGGGSDARRLRTLYGDFAQFLGRVTDEALADLYAHTRALVVPSIEEFGIAAVEAQASGRPVIAAAGGGALETVVDGETGVLVPPEDVDAIADVLRDDSLDQLVPSRAVANASRFSVGAFEAGIRAQVALACASQNGAS